MKNKKTNKKNRINPPLKLVKEKLFQDLKIGDCFIDNSGNLLMKTNETSKQSAISLVDGIIYDELCDSSIQPVDIQINWTRK